METTLHMIMYIVRGKLYAERRRKLEVYALGEHIFRYKVRRTIDQICGHLF